ncbi:MAG: TonB-dependent receptor, partial [Prevotellaceae bacterium]|nr:TonB-dependent receptor [Prevotellaceae bacterium]
DYFNYSLAAAGKYFLTQELGLTIDGTMTTRRPKIEDYATSYYPSTTQTKIMLGRGGLFFNNDRLSLTSLVSCIVKTNNRTVLNVNNPNPGMTDLKALAFNYNIQTIGWTTDAIVSPFRNFDLHFLLTYQKPTYKKFETTVNFKDKDGQERAFPVSATGNIVTEIPQILIEIDPGYTIAEKVKLWTSFRYFSKTYANLSNALYFNGHWETFGGVNYKINDKISLGATVINFFNQTGATGTIAGSELITKDEAGRFHDVYMVGKYLRPFTVEFSTNIHF